jgi:glucokinase
MSTGSPEGSSAASTAGAYADGPRLLADIGGTNARFALEQGPGQLGEIRTYPCKDFPEITDAVARFFSDEAAALKTPARHAAIAIANPIDGDQVVMTNHDWRFSIEATRKALKLDTLKVVNDFEALALAVPALRDDQRRQFGPGQPHPHTPMAVLGAGTGLGLAGLVPNGDRWIALPSEGGHVSFAPIDAREDAILVYARKKWGHVSFERLASGPGIALIYEALAAAHGHDAHAETTAAVANDTAAIVHSAGKGDALALEAIEVFCGVLGTFSGNVALSYGAHGGIYIGGGVVPKLGEHFYQSNFRARFEQKGRFDRYLCDIPTYVITAENPAFIGTSEILAAALA